MANKFLKGQSSLETAIAFVIIILLLGGIIKIWLWSNNEIVKRQIGYNKSRLAAGVGSDTYILRDHWPLKNVDTKYAPASLDDTIFVGQGD